MNSKQGTMSAKDQSCESQDAGQQEKRGKENELKPDEFCFECKSSLIKSPELINVTGQSCRRWHPECFKCMICREPMDKRQSCHIYRDQIVCRMDYLRLKRDSSIKCKRCRWPIGASDWVRKAADYVYHLACFTCDICFRQLNTGEQFVINSHPVDEINVHTNADCQDNNETILLMCKLHFTVDNIKQTEEKVVAPNASGAHTGLKRHSTRQGRSSPISGSPSPMSPEVGDINRQSSVKLNGKQRQRQQALKANHYHQPAPSGAIPTSSSAMSCSSSSTTALNHYQTPGLTVCSQLEQPPHSLMTRLPMSKDLSLMVPSPPNPSGLTIDENFTNQHRVPSSGPPSTPNSSSSSTSSTSSSSPATTLGCTSGPMTPSGCGGSGGLQSKSKRVRTTFTEDQLSILQTHFQIDSNPDGQDLERIATITGLSKRVTQVWFQNSRARQKKYMIKRKPSHSSAISMVASLAHGHHHDQHHHHHQHHLNRNHHQHFNHHLDQHSNAALMNQPISSPSELNTPSPTQEPNKISHAKDSDQQKIRPANSNSFSRQFLDSSFVSNTIQCTPKSNDKENEIECNNMDPESNESNLKSAGEQGDESDL